MSKAKKNLDLTIGCYAIVSYATLQHFEASLGSKI